MVSLFFENSQHYDNAMFFFQTLMLNLNSHTKDYILKITLYTTMSNKD